MKFDDSYVPPHPNLVPRAFLGTRLIVPVSGGGQYFRERNARYRPLKAVPYMGRGGEFEVFIC